VILVDDIHEDHIVDELQYHRVDRRRARLYGDMHDMRHHAFRNALVALRLDLLMVRSVPLGVPAPSASRAELVQDLPRARRHADRIRSLQGAPEEDEGAAGEEGKESGKASLLGRAFFIQRRTVLVKRKAFGGMKIKVDENLSKIFERKVGSLMSPSEMTKDTWRYIKRRNLMKR